MDDTSLIPVEAFLRAEIKLERKGKRHGDMGAFRFQTLPRVGEIVHVNVGDEAQWLRVNSVQHFANTEDSTPTPWDTMVQLICEKVE